MDGPEDPCLASSLASFVPFHNGGTSVDQVLAKAHCAFKLPPSVSAKCNLGS